MAREARLAAAFAAALICLCTPAASADPRGTTRYDVRITMDDGKALAATVFRPAGGAAQKGPVILDASPYYGAAGGSVPTTYWLDDWVADAGYTLLTVSLRGFGDSEGCVDYLGDRDRRDLGAVIDWVQAQPWSDGGLALAGFSYDGAAALAAIAARPRDVDAALFMSPALFQRGAFTDGVRYSTPMNVPAGGAGRAAYDLLGPSVEAAPQDRVPSLLEADPACVAEHLVGSQQADPDAPYWRERDLLPLVRGSRVPVFVGGGFEDWGVKPEAAPAVTAAFAGPKRTVLTQSVHVPVNDQDMFPDDKYIGRAGFSADLRAFLDEHVRGLEGDVKRPGAVVQEGTGGWRTERQWPPRDVESIRWAVRDGDVSDRVGNWGDGRLHFEVGNAPSPRQGAGRWTISQPLARDLHIAGVPVLRLGAASGDLVALLYDIAPDGTATTITRGARVLGAGVNDLRLQPQDWRVRQGHRIGLLLSGSDHQLYYTTPGPPVAVREASLALPYLPKARRDDLDGDIGLGMRARRPFVVDAATIDAAEVRQPEPRPRGRGRGRGRRR